MSVKKERIDLLLVERGYFDNLEKAKAALMAGLVYAKEERIEKAGMKISIDTPLKVKGSQHPYVSRGGLKLEKALKYFNIDLTGAVMVDVGASTGGFSDCALQHGADFIYAIDVGYNQLDWSIRTSPKVKVMERTNFRYIQPEDLSGPDPNFASIDVSFISLKLILPPLKELFQTEGQVVALIKPQFETSRENVGKSGVIKETEIHKEVLQSVLEFAEKSGYMLSGLTFSPITGGEGNIEFLAYWKLNAETASNIDKGKLIREVAAEAAKSLHT